MQVRFRPVIRVFVSSTFTDLQLERDALQKEVFPKLEQLCASRRFQFQAIDLRWGVPSEAKPILCWNLENIRKDLAHNPN